MSNLKVNLPYNWRSVSFDANYIDKVTVIDSEGHERENWQIHDNHHLSFGLMEFLEKKDADVVKIHHLMQSCGDFDSDDMGTITFVNLNSPGILIKEYKNGPYDMPILLIDTGYGQYPITRDSANYNQVKNVMLKHNKIYLNNVDGCFQLSENKLPSATMTIELPYVSCMHMIKDMNKEPTGLWKIGSVIWKTLYLEIIWVDTTDEKNTKSFVIGGVI